MSRQGAGRSRVPLVGVRFWGGLLACLTACALGVYLAAESDSTAGYLLGYFLVLCGGPGVIAAVFLALPRRLRGDDLREQNEHAARSDNRT